MDRSPTLLTSSISPHKSHESDKRRREETITRRDVMTRGDVRVWSYHTAPTRLQLFSAPSCRRQVSQWRNQTIKQNPGENQSELRKVLIEWRFLFFCSCGRDSSALMIQGRDTLIFNLHVQCNSSQSCGAALLSLMTLFSLNSKVRGLEFRGIFI